MPHETKVISLRHARGLSPLLCTRPSFIHPCPQDRPVHQERGKGLPPRQLQCCSPLRPQGSPHGAVLSLPTSLISSLTHCSVRMLWHVQSPLEAGRPVVGEVGVLGFFPLLTDDVCKTATLVVCWTALAPIELYGSPVQRKAG